MANVGEHFDAHRLASGLKAPHHLMSVRVVSGEEHYLFAVLRKRMATNRACRHVRIERFVERVLAEIFNFVDRIRLADGIEDDLAVFSDIIDRQLHGG